MNRGWPMVRVGELLTLYQEYIETAEPRLYRKLSVRLYGKGVVLDAPADGTTLKMKRHQLARAGQVILSEIWGKKGAIGFVPEAGEGALCTSHFFLFDVRSEKLNPKWLQAIFDANYLQDQLDAEAKGTTGYAAVRPKILFACEIPLPPLSEQQRIVARIQEMAGSVRKARVLRQEAAQQTEALVASHLSSLFKAGPSKGWIPGRLGDYVIDDCYGTSDKTTDDETGVPVLRMGNIQNGRLNTRSLKYLHLSERDRRRLRLLKGDILVNRTNSAELVGKCAVFDLDIECSFASYLIRIRVDQDRANPGLVAAYINSPLGREYMLKEKRQMTGQANVNATRLKALPIVLPPLPEQHRIMLSLDALQKKIDAARRTQSETSAELDALTPSILDKAFRGEL